MKHSMRMMQKVWDQTNSNEGTMQAAQGKSFPAVQPPVLPRVTGKRCHNSNVDESAERSTTVRIETRKILHLSARMKVYSRGFADFQKGYYKSLHFQSPAASHP